MADQEEGTEVTEDVSPLELSDEEIMNGSAPADLEPEERGEEEGSEETGEEAPEVPEQTEEIASTPESLFDEEEDEVPAPEAEKAPEEQKASKKAKEEPVEEEPGPAGAINYQEEYERLLAPFKANGRQMQISSVDDALQLMQMGANYNKKMAGLKPNLKLMKMLEKNDLLDEQKLSFLIDLQTKDPAAVAKFMKDSEIDPLDVDIDKGNEYKPKAYTVDDKEVDLDGVLEDIKDTPTFNDTIDIISNKWDAPSKQVLLDNPTLIKVINEHVESGIYNSIHDIVENERALGRLQNMSDIEAYKHVGDVIQANGGFNPQQPAAAPETQPKAQESQQQQSADPKLNDRRRAASSTKSAPATGGKQDYNPLDLSDEEFEKMAGGMM